jgi:hypothetical protein
MLKINGYWVDQALNKWDAEIYSKELAEELSLTMEGCMNCIDCSHCTFCVDCRECDNCVCCDRCNGCQECSYLENATEVIGLNGIEEE